uniref:Death domain-containing protein n=1 Tax=Amphimedon queenslandica TaxID=400682 RepID=A0A1X7VVE5_AMPQE
MIDVSQWRASIGLWNYCQAASSRSAANGCHSHSFKAAVDSKSGSTTSGEKTSKLPAALSFIVSLLLSLLRYMKLNFFLPTGDVELNPGPMIDDQPNIFLLLQWLKPLVDWQSFGLLLPGITQQDITTIEDFEIDKEQSKEGLFSKWLKKNPTATWRDVLNALNKREEINLLQTINDQLQVHQCTGGNTDAPTSTVSVVSTVSSSVSVITKPVTSTSLGNPKDILRTHSVKLTDAITTNLYRVTDVLYAEGLIPLNTKRDMYSLTGENESKKTGKLLITLQATLESSLNPEHFLYLPQLKILHLLMDNPTIPTVDNTYCSGKCTELEKCIEMNSTLQEMKIEYSGRNEITSTIISVIRGVTRNKTITSLTIHDPLAPPPPLCAGVLEQLLKDNNTLQALSLYIPYELLLSTLNIVEVNTPLTALGIREWKSSKLMTSSLLPHIKGLHCLILHDPYSPHLLFLSHPSLQTLSLPLDTADSAIELFTILKTNTTLKALSVKIKEDSRVYTSHISLEEEGTSSIDIGSSSSPLILKMLMQDLLTALSVVMVCNSLQDMLTHNQMLKYLEINNDIDVPSSFLSFLTTGLRHNTSLQQLSVSISLNEEILKTFINVISRKNNLTELKVNFTLDQSCSNCSGAEKKQIMTPLFYEPGTTCCY